MTPQEIDVIVRVAGATLMIWTAITRRTVARPFYVPLVVCLCGFLAGNTPDADLQLSGWAGRLGVIAAGYAAVFLWWYCLAVFDARFRPRGLTLAVGLLWVVIASADRGMFGPLLASKGLSWGLVGLGLGMVAHLGWTLWRDRIGDLIDGRRRARMAVVVVLAGQLLADLAVDLVLGLDWGPQAFSILQNGALLATIIWLQSLDLTPVPVKGGRVQVTRRPGEGGGDPALAVRLERLMTQDRVFLDPDLSLERFARAAGASERAVRRQIHLQFGHDHFRTFLNAWRVDEARRLLRDPARSHDKLVTIAFDSGFASLPSFNRVFREMEGCSPGLFRNAGRAEPGTVSVD